MSKPSEDRTCRPAFSCGRRADAIVLYVYEQEIDDIQEGRNKRVRNFGYENDVSRS